MKKRLFSLLLTLFTLTTIALPISAQDPIEIPTVALAGLPFAGIIENHLIIFDGFGSPTDYEFAGLVRSFNWDETGDQLAVLASGESGLELYYINLAQDLFFKYETGAIEAFPPSFTSFGNILYVEEGENRVLDPATPYLARLMQVQPEAGATPLELGTFELRLECDGGAVFPADAAYWSETGFGAAHMMLRETPFGILHSQSCGGMGYALLNPETGEDTPIPNAENFMRGVLSDDGSTLVALDWTFDPPLHQTALARVDLATLAITDFPTERMPEQIALASDGRIYFSHRELRDDSVFPVWTSQIRVFNPITNEETTVFESEDVYAIGRILEIDPSLIMYSTIPNMINPSTVDPLSIWILAAGTPEQPTLFTQGVGQFAPRPLASAR